jgi:hypothetical protein
MLASCITTIASYNGWTQALLVGAELCVLRPVVPVPSVVTIRDRLTGLGALRWLFGQREMCRK